MINFIIQFEKLCVWVAVGGGGGGGGGHNFSDIQDYVCHC